MLFELLLANEAPTKILPKHFDYINVFPPNLTIGLSEHTNMNNYMMKLEESK